MIVTALVLALAPSAVHGQGQVLDYYLTHIGYQRHYKLYVPSGYTPGNSTPLVLNIPSAWGNTQMTLVSKMNPVAERERFLIAYPDAYGGASGGPDKGDPYDDLGFLDALIAEVSSNYAVDASRVYATGFSGGAVISYVLSVKFPYTFAAVASVAGVRAYSPGTDIIYPPDVPLTPSRPFPLLHIHGTADLQVPYNGGVSTINGWNWPACEEVVGGYVANDGCNSTPTVEDLLDIDLTDGCAWKPPDPPCSLSSTVQVLAYGNCGTYLDAAGNARPAEVLLYRVVGGGHNWPGDSSFGPSYWNFPENRDISASEKIWTFFSRHRVAVAWADLDSDLDVDASDFEVFHACSTGPAVPYDSANPPDGCSAAQLVRADADGDLDVDMDDFGLFQRCYNGAGQRPGMDCAR